MSETVLVTGGTGFVGGWCIAELLRRGHKVRTTVRNLSKEQAVRAAVATETDPGGRLAVFAADLNSDAGWDDAVEGAGYVLHVASPLGARNNDDARALISAARDGTLRVLAAARRARVKRVVLTSSTAASAPKPNVREAVSDEAVWTDPTARGLTPYRQSKIYAERAAWEFMKSGGGPTELTAVLPTGIFGPVLTAEGLGSVVLVQRLLNGSMPGIPNIGFNVVDVRDLADLHIRAMTAPEAAAQRFIGGGEFMWMADIARVLRDNLGDRARKVPKRMLPNILLRLAALTNPAMKEVSAMLGHKHDVTSAKAQRMLDWKSGPAKTAVLDCAESLFAKGAV
jgi:nucleoside-diphosphate-sugar epimerase